jgi:acyl-coenzyme A thioesterase PaaI-like protein
VEDDGDRQVGFTSELGLEVEVGDTELRGRARCVPELCLAEAGTERRRRSVPEETSLAASTNGAGVVRPSVLLTWADILMGSLANEHTLPQVCMTVDLSVRVAAPIAAGHTCRSVGRLLKVGRTLTFAETTFFVDGSRAPAAIALGTFVASPRPQDVSFSVVDGEALSHRLMTTPPSPVSTLLGTTVVAPGVVEVPRHPKILNWADTVQGGAVAACAEEAVLALGDTPAPTELEVRYLSSVRTGPMRATASRFGSWIRVEVVDVGADGRRVAIAAARGD